MTKLNFIDFFPKILTSVICTYFANENKYTRKINITLLDFTLLA